MREIKFRAWDTEENKWYKPVYRAYEGKLFEILIGMNGCVVTRNMDGVGIGLPRFEIMQYTGLKDKNGKEVYEGDCFSVNNPTTKTRYGVCWVVYNHSFGRYELEDNIQDGEFDFNYFARNGKIIGNIYENPELLKDHAKK